METCSPESAVDCDQLREFELMDSSSTLRSVAPVTNVMRGAQELVATVPQEPVVSVRDVSQHYGKAVALDGINLDIPAQQMIGLIGPDGVGKSTLLGMVAGVRRIQTGKVTVLGGDIASARFRNEVSSRI